MTDNDKIQKIEIDTVKAVTELKADIKNLTSSVNDLKDSITRMNENYATKSELKVAVDAHARDIIELHEKCDAASRSWKVKALLWSLLSVLLTSLLMYVIEDVTKK